MDAVRVAVVGLGGNGRSWVQSYRAAERAEVVGLCDLSPERLELARQVAPDVHGYADLAEMLATEAPDALSVHTPDHLHADPFIRAWTPAAMCWSRSPWATPWTTSSA